MTEKESAELYTAKKLAEAVGVSEGKVKKLLVTLDIQPDEVKGNCKYYGPAALAKIKAELGG